MANYWPQKCDRHDQSAFANYLPICIGRFAKNGDRSRSYTTRDSLGYPGVALAKWRREQRKQQQQNTIDQA